MQGLPYRRERGVRSCASMAHAPGFFLTDAKRENKMRAGVLCNEINLTIG